MIVAGERPRRSAICAIETLGLSVVGREGDGTAALDHPIARHGRPIRPHAATIPPADGVLVEVVLADWLRGVSLIF
jgi:hypothetical protein